MNVIDVIAQPVIALTNEVICFPRLPMNSLHLRLLSLSQGIIRTQRSKALHFSAKGVTIVPGSNPGCITSGRNQESHGAGTQLAPASSGFGRGRPSL